MDKELPVSLNDRFVMLLESVVAENRRLRETIEARNNGSFSSRSLLNLMTQHSKVEKGRERSQFHNSVV